MVSQTGIFFVYVFLFGACSYGGLGLGGEGFDLAVEVSFRLCEPVCDGAVFVIVRECDLLWLRPVSDCDSLRGANKVKILLGCKSHRVGR